MGDGLIYRDDLPTRALSIRQPWAWAIVHSTKRLENRSAGAIRVGQMEAGIWIAIHASKGMTRGEYEDARDTFRIAGVEDQDIPRPCDLVRGGIIGRAFVKAVVSEAESPWFCGPCALVLTDVAACVPFGVKGQLGFFDWQAFGDLEQPAAWMLAWPDDALRAKLVKPAPSALTLFDAQRGGE